MRLVPRFSLRFALLALTIFLIVFGVGVKYWRDYQEHERLAKAFNRNGMLIEEEPLTLAGYFLGKRATGLLVESNYAEPSDLELLAQLPRPRDVRRLSFVGGKNLKDQFQKILDAIVICPEGDNIDQSLQAANCDGIGQTMSAIATTCGFDNALESRQLATRLLHTQAQHR